MRRILGILLLLALIGGAYGLFQFNKGPVNLKNNSADIQISSKSLFADFKKDEAAFNTEYLSKILEVEGKVTGIKTKDGITTITLASDDMMFGVNCQMAADAKNLDSVKKGSVQTIKGQCDGGLMDVILTKCWITSK